MVDIRRELGPENCLANNRGVHRSTPKPIIHNMNLIGGGTKTDTNHIPAAKEILWNTLWKSGARMEPVF